jgi:hypothetical protein
VRIRVAVPEKHVSPSVINAALEAVTRVDHAMIEAGEAPAFHPRHARWRPENFGEEHFDHAGIVVQRGWGDCDDLAPWRAASLRASGEDPGAVAIAVPSGPDMYHAIVRRSDGSNDDPSVAAGMKAKSVVGDGENVISVWACDPHDGRMYQGSLAPVVAPITPHCGPTFAVRPISASGSKSVVGYEARMDAPVVGSRMARVERRRHRVHVHERRRHHVHGWAPYALSTTAGGEGFDVPDALRVACAGVLQAGVCAGTLSLEDKYKLFTMHRLLAGHHPSDIAIELAHMMDDDQAHAAAAGYAVQGYHGYIVGGFNFGHFLKGALKVVSDVSPALAAIPGVGPALAVAVPVVNTMVDRATEHHDPMTPAPAMTPQPAALAAWHHIHHHPYARPAPPRPRPPAPAPAAPSAFATAASMAQQAAAAAPSVLSTLSTIVGHWDSLEAMHRSADAHPYYVRF